MGGRSLDMGPVEATKRRNHRVPRGRWTCRSPSCAMVKRPYMVVIDPDGAEIAQSRRHIGAWSHSRALKLREEMEAAMGDGCSVEVRG